MSASLVGSEMCIRDRPTTSCTGARPQSRTSISLPQEGRGPRGGPSVSLSCLLYTSDAADDM
eukprot:8435523-Alexandrium_andersonii.AAC.1